MSAHYYVAKEQAAYYKELKANLIESECLVKCDFAQNFSNTHQNEIQSAHWTKVQSTVFTIIIYLIKDGVVNSKSLCVISDDLNHDAAAIDFFIEKILEKLYIFIPKLKKLKFFSDGGPGHLKNMYNFANISMFHADYGLDIEWHFMVTCHGKNAFD